MKLISNLTVKLGKNSYKIVIDKNFPFKIKKKFSKIEEFSKIIVITDKTINNIFDNEIDKFCNELKSEKIILPSGEKTKSFKYLEYLMNKILSKKVDRKALLICIGGGVIGDLVGLAASLTLRGIDFIQIPTTLLSQVDSSVGGKTAINSIYGKNLIGTFYQPKIVIISLYFLRRLPKREIISGYAEILKYSLIKDKVFFIWLENNSKKILNLNSKACAEAIRESCRIKSLIVSKDEKEKNLREILNFGHTFGHALESITGFSNKLNHGESIFVGMYIAIKFSVFLGFCKKRILYDYTNHLDKLNISYKLSDYNITISPNLFLKHLKFDKKVKEKKIRFILLSDIGKVKVYKLNEEKVLLDFLKKEKF